MEGIEECVEDCSSEDCEVAVQPPAVAGAAAEREVLAALARRIDEERKLLGQDLDAWIRTAKQRLGPEPSLGLNQASAALIGAALGEAAGAAVASALAAGAFAGTASAPLASGSGDGPLAAEPSLEPQVLLVGPASDAAPCHSFDKAGRDVHSLGTVAAAPVEAAISDLGPLDQQVPVPVRAEQHERLQHLRRRAWEIETQQVAGHLPEPRASSIMLHGIPAVAAHPTWGRALPEPLLPLPTAAWRDAAPQAAEAVCGPLGAAAGQQRAGASAGTAAPLPPWPPALSTGPSPQSRRTIVVLGRKSVPAVVLC